LIFFKPNTCIWDHGADVVIPKIAQDGQADYEGELVGSQKPLIEGRVSNVFRSA
jgi:hypothetical protein